MASAGAHIRIMCACIRATSTGMRISSTLLRIISTLVRIISTLIRTTRALIFFQELCEGGELFDRILAKGGLYSEKDAATIIRSILSVRRMRSECK